MAECGALGLFKLYAAVKDGKYSGYFIPTGATVVAHIWYM